MKWISRDTGGVISSVAETCAEITFTEDKKDYYVELEHRLSYTAVGDEYVLLPACCYDGNRFDVSKQDYPPLFTPEQARVDMPVTITDVPRLEKDGSGSIEVTTGDLSVPCIGVFSRREKKAVFIFTIQQINGINLGISYEKGAIRVTYPRMRKREMYRWPHMVPSDDKGIDFTRGTRVEIPFRVYEIPCDNLQEFYRFFFRHRKCMGMDDTVPQLITPAQQFELQKNKLNSMNWREKSGIYSLSTNPDLNYDWSPGWVGGGMYTFPLMKLGGKLEWERSMRTLDFMFRYQSSCGLLYECVKEDATPNTENPVHRKPYSGRWIFIRKNGDALYYIFKHFYLMKERGVEVPQKLEVGTRKLADALVSIWERYGQLGQFVDCETGDIIVGGSTAAGIVPGALIEAGFYFDDDRYVRAAKEIAAYYCGKVAEEGYTTGGPAEILQCPDSESAFGLLESLAALYNRTGEGRWLEYGKFMVEFCSSWVVAYNYRFKENSEFNKLDMKSTGCVFANAQNKHAAPGICTYSGYSIKQFYEWTGDEQYLQLYREVTGTVHQFFSREDRIIHSWPVPKDATLLDESERVYVEPKALLPGYICERVNMSDWETEACIGGVFHESCLWCETAGLMILAECQSE